MGKFWFSGDIILFPDEYNSILIRTEIKTFCLLNNNGFSLSKSYFFLLVLTFLWIGAQFPQEKFLSYGRILTLHYYFLLMCILSDHWVETFLSDFYWHFLFMSHLFS